MKQGTAISYNQTNSAAKSVQQELYKIGLWYADTRLYKTEIFWAQMPFVVMPIMAAGVFTHGTSSLQKFMGYAVGHIYIPRVVLSQTLWQNRGSLRDVIRHEYGHAVAHYYPELVVESAKFEKVFGGNYYSGEPAVMLEADYISEYARSLPMEDFAETFMIYVREEGVLPSSFTNKKIINKWNFINDLCKKIGGV